MRVPEVAAVSPGQAAEILQCSRGTIDSMLDDGVLDSVRYGQRRFIPTESIRSFLDGQQAG